MSKMLISNEMVHATVIRQPVVPLRNRNVRKRAGREQNGCDTVLPALFMI